MNLETILPLSMFALLFLLILSGVPVAFSLMGAALIAGLAGYWCDIFYLSDFGLIPDRLFELVIQNFTLIAVPLFIFMGITLEKSGLAERLLLSLEFLLQRYRGGLCIALILVGALLAASTGIVGATVVTMGALSLPTMLSRNYDKGLACGTITASGTLGQIIPPSIVLVLLGDMMNVPVADLFAGAMLPGLGLVLLYIAYVVVRIYVNPELAPLHSVSQSQNISMLSALASVVPAALLMLIVLGSILTGIASPTESAACGAVGALCLAGVQRKLNINVIREVCNQTTSMTTMVFTLLVGAQFFSIVFRGLYGDELITDFLLELEVGGGTLFLIVMILVFFLGFFLDFIEICFIVVPLIGPILVNEFGFSGLWVAVMFAVNLQTSFLTPPFGFALFYLKAVAPPEVSTATIYRGVVPFVVIQVVMLVILWCFPKLTTALPSYLFG